MAGNGIDVILVSLNQAGYCFVRQCTVCPGDCSVALEKSMSLVAAGWDGLSVPVSPGA